MRTNKLFWLTLMIAALLLSACGGAPAEAPTAQPAATAPAAQAPTAAQPTAAPSQPTPAFESVTDTEPTIGAAPALGALAWRDQVLRNDAIFVSASGLPAPEDGQVYSAWLSNKDGSLALGPLQASAGGLLALNFASPTQENLLGTYDQLYVTRGAPSGAADANNVVLSGGLPANALVHIRHVLFSIGNTPGKIGFALGLRQETDELLRHAQFLKDAFDQGNFALEKTHAEHIVNIIEGSQGEHFGDLNGDGKVQNPGDGFGILQNGQQDGYVKGMSDHAKLAADATDATDAIKLHAGHVQIAGENTRVRVTDIRDRALNISKAGGIADTQQDVLNILSLAQQTIQGVDINQDEQVGPIPGEGGVLTAYQHAQLMAGIALAPGSAATAPPAAQPAPAAAAQEFTIEIGDNTFTPNKLTIPVGATVVWNDKGQHPHTVTADDGSFDSQELQNGATFKQTFAQAGEFPFFCKFHGGKGGEGMAGSIIVTAQSSAAAPAAAAPTAAPAQPQPPAAGATTVQVAIGDNTFTPKEISVPVGATVVWTHGGQRQHTVTADDNSFKSDTLKNGDTFKQTFDKPGTYAYYCEFHGGPGGGGMSGVITVGGGGSPPAAPTTAPPAPPTAAPPAPPAAATVSMKDFEFGPKEIHVKAGTTITWKNEGAKPHSATAVDKSFDTAIFQPGESKSVTFSTPGTFAYFCQLHGSPDGKSAMVGTVVVDP